MRFLLDTHSWLWWIADDPRLSATARSAMSAADTDILFSVVSAWEMAIKAGLGRLRVPDDFAAFVVEQLNINRFAVLPIALSHALAVRDLVPHHRDPFDRMLAAQARVEELPIVSRDPVFDAYGIKRLW